MTTLADLLMERFKVKTRPRVDPLGVSPIGVNPVVLLRNNPNRLAYIIMNLSANLVYIGLTNQVNATVGTEVGLGLEPNRGFVSMVWDEDFDMVAWAWWGIAAAAPSILTIIEIVSI